MKRFTVCIGIIFLFNIIIPLNSVKACTAFSLTQKGKYVLVGKNLDWPIGDGFIMINPRGVSKISMVNPGQKPTEWVSKYGSVTFNQFGKEFPLGGMNEAGLIVEEVSFSPSVFPNKRGLSKINEMQWIQYQLDNYGTVEEVIKNIHKLQISKFLFGLHYLLSDRFGNTAVIEFINGKTLIYNARSLPMPVLSNNSYKNSIKYLKIHKSFGGDRVPTNGPESQERFVRASELIQKYQWKPCKITPSDIRAFNGLIKSINLENI